MLPTIDRDIAMRVEAASGGVAIKLPVCKDLVLDNGKDLLAEYQKGRKVEVAGYMTTEYKFLRRPGFPFFSVNACSEYRCGIVLVDGHPLYRFRGSRLESVM